MRLPKVRNLIGKLPIRRVSPRHFHKKVMITYNLQKCELAIMQNQLTYPRKLVQVQGHLQQMEDTIKWMETTKWQPESWNKWINLTLTLALSNSFLSLISCMHLEQYFLVQSKFHDVLLSLYIYSLWTPFALVALM